MNCSCKVEQRRLTPGVFNLKQFLNGSETMVWELDNCVINQGTCDLKNYDAFLTLCVGGEIDEILLTKRQSGDKLQLIWDVGTYATALTGYVKYQICFRSANFDTLGVIADDPEGNGVYALTDHNATGNARIYKKAENGYTIKWDTANGRWALYKADGATIVDYQTTPNTEPHCGLWANIGVGNNEAAAWISDEAIMYISDSIAADQTITGGFPTILRQLWKKIAKAGVTSVNGKVGIVELAPDDIGAAAKQHKHQIADTDGLQAALNNKANAGHTHTIANVSGLQSALDGKLSLTGGTITGTLNVRNDQSIKQTFDNGALRICAGTSDGSPGAVFFGKGHSSMPGQFRVRSYTADGATVGDLIGDATAKTLTWFGKNVARSVDGVNAGADGNVALGALKTTGGTMTGWIDLNISGAGIRSTITNGITYLMGGTNGNTGSYIQLKGKDNGGAAAGGNIILAATDGTLHTYLSLAPNGRMMVGGKDIVRSVNGLNADTTGAVSFNCISNPTTLASNADLNSYKGYSSLGYYTAPSDAIAKTIANRPCDNAFALEVFCGDTTITYQRATRYSNNDMWVRRNYNGTWSAWRHILVFEGDTPLWNGKDISSGYPNYSAGVAVGTVSTYTATADGWVHVSKQHEATYVTVKVNGAIVVNGGGSSHDRTSGIFPVKKGDVVTVYKTDKDQSSSTSTTSSVIFYPNR